MVTAEELFGRCLDIAANEEQGVQVNRQMHETLAMACGEGTARLGQCFGNVFAQVDFLCKRCGVATADKIAVQTMRVHSNSSEPLPCSVLLADLRTLCLFISAVFHADIPDELTLLLPHDPLRPATQGERKPFYGYIRCIVDTVAGTDFVATTTDGRQITIDCHDDETHDLSYLSRIVRNGTQLNLLDATLDGDCARPTVVVVEPDFLVDISSVAKCFTDYGHSPLAYTFNRLSPRANSQAILLGNFASDALDDIINNDHFSLADTIARSSREQALQLATCKDYSAGTFLAEAKRQSDNLREVVDQLFGTANGYDRHKALLEPSFVCERLGLQGRADLLTTDFRLLVEQKSGKNWQIERNATNSGAVFSYIEAHYVQLLLYYGVLRYNFGVSPDKIDFRLLYSKYPANKGLIVVNYYRKLFLEAIRLRNRIVAGEYMVARKGFGSLSPFLSADRLKERGGSGPFFERYVKSQAEAVTSPLRSLSPLENAYFNRMATFVYREQIAQRVGSREGVAGSMADLWQMPLAEKKETGNIFADLSITRKEQSSDYSGYDLITLHVPEQTHDFLPNFRRGDMVYLYHYDNIPDARRNILFKGVMSRIAPNEITIRLNDGQQNAELFPIGTYAVEHGSSDAASSSSLRSLHSFISSPPDWRKLLLGQREPRRNHSLSLTRSYNPFYDDVLLKAKQSLDYFLLVGPPGTGKTSMALRFLVEEELTEPQAQLLLMAYTNRAVDEICSMLADDGQDFIRLGNDSSCDPRFTSYLICGEDDVTQRIESRRIVVSTTSTMLARPFLFTKKRFTLTIVDEASQILEPNIMGLLTGRFILIGDHKQLPAVVVQSEREGAVTDPLLLQIGIGDCRQSLFSRLLRWERSHGRTQFVGTLRRQGRMHPDIAQFPNEMFYADEKLECVPCPHQRELSLGYDLPSIDTLDGLLKRRRVMFLHVEPSLRERGAKSNTAEARIVADLLRRIARFYGDAFRPATTVGVIVPYRNQIATVRREIASLHLPALCDVTIDTVERYQGSQRDVIIYSFTVTRPFQLDFLTANTFEEDGHTIDPKLNVAITRARKQLIMLGHIPTLRRNQLFAELIDRYCIGLTTNAMQAKSAKQE